VSRAQLESAHQPQLQGMAPVLSQYPYPAEVSRICRVGGREQSGKRNRVFLVKSKPPMPSIKCRNGRAAKEREAMKFSELVGIFVLASIDLAVLYIGGDPKTRSLAGASVICQAWL
jgi:hypothetical protein